ncbi:serine/threonine-protein kinase Nek2, partial [Clarias magur]
MPSRTEDYEVISTIGSGSYGKCQKIRRKSDGKILVWKELDYGTMAEVEKQMLVSEVNLLRELRHPNIVRYYDRIIDRANATLYIVMEFCEGGDLATLITKCIKEKRYLEEEFVLRVMAQLSLALKECHSRNDGGSTVLHRDLKPANIFLDAKRNVKLGDFGLARILKHDTSFAKTFVGTPYYMSPEQMNRMSYNEKSDIWSLGCLLYELCALIPPFTAYNQEELAEKINEGRFRRIPYRYSDELNTLLCRMLHLKDFLRPSVESILQSSLISAYVAQEQKKAQARQQRGSCDLEQPKLEELKLKEQALRQREQHLKEREQRLEQKEHELCIRERLANEKLARAESLLKTYNLMRHQRAQSPLYSEDRDESTDMSPGKKKVHFAGDSKENVWPEQRVGTRAQARVLIKKLQAVNIGEVERNYQPSAEFLLKTIEKISALFINTMPSRTEDYEVISTIGSGSDGKCQKIRRKSDGKILVWKELDYGTMAEVETQMLVSEVNLLRELKHPNIVRYYDHIIDRANTTLYIVMEFCEGGDLATLITKCIKEKRYLEEEFVLRVMAQLSLALKECHSRNDGGSTVLHRDLKPANVFLDAKQNVKLGDFGLARILEHDTSFAKTFVGTPYYMSPEQMNRMSYNEKSDIWSLGCLLYELCALSPPFTASNQEELAEKINEGRFRRIPYCFSDELNTLLCRMLHLKDFLRLSVETILQSSLISAYVPQEQKAAQARQQRGSCDLELPKLEELKLKEQALQQREQHLKEREERLEQIEQQVCIRERLVNERMA